jgi:cytochrome c biogenesis protein CcdA/thiol-disulfide isomerase/thioredoxin
MQMLLLALFALVAGAGTAITPCVLPVLPALLSASATGGRRRPLGIVLGLGVTHTIVIVGVASLAQGVGLAEGGLRTAAILVLLAFGIALVVPRLADRIEAPLSRLARFGPRTGGDGFWSGLLVGGALGFVYAPCAGPILAAVISVSASQGTTGELVLVALAYAAGSSAVLLLIALGGRRVGRAVRRAGRGPQLQRALGVLMVATAVAMLAELDLRFQTALANDVPDFIVNPTKGLERSDAVESRLADLRGRPRFRSRDHASLPVLGRAPDFTGTQRWFNTPAGRPLTLAGLRGRVVLIDFWTYTCINCIRTLPYLRAWDREYRDRGLTIVGVHTPEFGFERDAGNVERATRRERLGYAVAQDNEYATWNAWGNQYWPAKYLIDAQGQVRYTHFGEGEYQETEAAIRTLLAEAGRSPGERARARAESADPAVATPETYLGAERAPHGLWLHTPAEGTRDYTRPRGALPPNHFALGGTWQVDGESATAARDATIDAQFAARKVFLVMSARRPSSVGVRVDGRLHRTVRVSEQQLYTLVELEDAGEHRLTVELPPGVSGYAFTFG